MSRISLTAKLIKEEYTQKGKSDNQIACEFGYDRTTIVKTRQKYGVVTRERAGRVGEKNIIQYLQSLGVSVTDMNKENKLAAYDLLLDGYLRAEVKTSSLHTRMGREGWLFVLTQKPELGIKSGDYITLSSGRSKKNLQKTCDVVFLVGIISKDVFDVFIVPPSEIPLEMQTIGIGKNGFSKYDKWLNNFDVLGELLRTKREATK
jgi:hypothetical protein